MMNYCYLTYDDRHIIEKLYSAGKSPAEIAKQIGKSVSAVYHELKKGSTGAVDANYRLIYSASLGQCRTMENYRRRGRQPNKN